MVNDQEPRYRLVDSNGNVVGSLFQNADGNVEIQDETGTGSVFGPDGIVTPAIDAESVSAKESVIGNGTVLRSSDGWETIEGTDADDRLDNALDKVSEGDVIYLENAEYSKERTGTDSIDEVGGDGFTIIGATAIFAGTSIASKWVIDNRIRLSKIDYRAGDGELTINGRFSQLHSLTINGLSDGLLVDADDVLIYGIQLPGDMTFADGTNGGLIDASYRGTVTDNGSNTVGDVV